MKSNSFEWDMIESARQKSYISFVRREQNMVLKVTASEVQRDFEAYHDLALLEPVEVTRSGLQTVVIISAERFRALKQAERRVLTVDELSEAEMALVEKAEIPAQHRYHSADVEQ